MPLSGFPICKPCLDMRLNPLPTFFPMEGVQSQNQKTVRVNDCESICILWSVLRVFWLLNKQINVMPQPWLSCSKKVWTTSLKWGTALSCRSRGCKNIRTEVGSRKENTNLAGLAYFFRSPTLTSDIFVVTWPKWMFSILFERSIHICFEPEAHGYSTTLKSILKWFKYD